jgi:hypothetical protein
LRIAIITSIQPCQYSIDELKTRLEKARNSAKEGKYKTQSEMRSKYAL